MPEAFSSGDRWTPLRQVAVDTGLTAIGMAGVLALPFAWKIVASCVVCLGITRLFILGHDACHGSLFRSGLLNQVVGRLLFLPTVTPFSLWHMGHNLVHHRFTNIKDRDFVWVPMDPREYASASTLRRNLEQLYRSPWGMGLYYCFRIWWSELMTARGLPGRAKHIIPVVDRVIVLAALFAYIASLIAFAMRAGQSVLELLLCGFGIPFILWNYTMGLVIFLHHTHPDIPWYRVHDERRRRRPQLSTDVTPMTRLPLGLHHVLHSIMLHEAHHLNTRIPNFQRAQLAQTLRDGGRDPETRSLRAIERWADIRTVFRLCQLYDFDNRRWISFKLGIKGRRS